MGRKVIAKYEKQMKISIFMIFALILTACLNQTVEHKIVKRIETTCKQFPCVISIKEVTDFDWDKMFVFDYGKPFDEIEKLTGTQIPIKTEFTRKLVFTNNGKLTHYDELPTDIENIVNNEVIFTDPTGNSQKKEYAAEDAIFEAQKYSQGGEIYYQLKQITPKN